MRSRLDVGNEDLRLLADFESIERLSLVGTQVTNAAVPHLKQFTRLRFLDVSGTEITDDGIAELQKALPNCRISSMTTPPTTPKPRRRWLQFSLRTLMVLFGSPDF